MKRSLPVLGFLFIVSVVSFAQVMKVEVEGFTINAPLGWIAQYTKTPNVFVLYSPIEENDAFQENCNLTVEALPGKYSVKAYMDQSMKAIKTVYKNLKTMEAKDNYHIIVGQINDTVVQQIQFFYIKDNNAYVLTFSSTPDNFERYVEVFREIAKSFKY